VHDEFSTENIDTDSAGEVAFPPAELH